MEGGDGCADASSSARTRGGRVRTVAEPLENLTDIVWPQLLPEGRQAAEMIPP